MKMYTVYDSKAEAYLPPFFLKTNGEAIRAFTDAVATNEQFKKWPEDYTLFEIAEWNELTGELSPLKAAKSLGKGIDYVKQQEGK